MPEHCLSRRVGDQYMCSACGLQWDVSDRYPPDCWRKPTGAMDQQVGGSHYKGLRIQPIKFAMINGWDAGAFSILKYLTRWHEKGGVEDLKKARHFVDLRQDLIEHVPVPPHALVPMNRYLGENESIRRDTWPALLTLDELVKASPRTKQQTPDGLAPVHVILATDLKNLIDELIRAHGPVDSLAN